MQIDGIVHGFGLGGGKSPGSIHIVTVLILGLFLDARIWY